MGCQSVAKVVRRFVVNVFGISKAFAVVVVALFAMIGVTIVVVVVVVVDGGGSGLSVFVNCGKIIERFVNVN